uniref:Uncharacterized protein n=1 Tax=Seriola dumerili TaxID=41447 RepID=A0A3B4U6Z2_SERDU
FVFDHPENSQPIRREAAEAGQRASLLPAGGCLLTASSGARKYIDDTCLQWLWSAGVTAAAGSTLWRRSSCYPVWSAAGCWDSWSRRAHCGAPRSGSSMVWEVSD